MNYMYFVVSFDIWCKSANQNPREVLSCCLFLPFSTRIWNLCTVCKTTQRCFTHLCKPTRTHTFTHTLVHSLRAWCGPYPKARWQAAGDDAKASCRCPTSAQLSELRGAFEQPITPTHHQGKAISSRGTLLSHQMAREMNRAIILVLDNSSDEAN